MRHDRFRVGSGLAALFVAAPMLAQADLPMDTPTTVSGIESVCTGIGSTAQSDPRWAAYPLKVEVVGKNRHYLADADLMVAQGGKQLLAVHCGGPWLLLKLPAGRYSISGILSGETATAGAVAPATGQSRAILRFPGTDD